MRAIMIQRSHSDHTYQIAGDRPFRTSKKGLKRRTDLEGLVHHGGQGGDNAPGQVYEDQYGSLLVRVS